MPLAVRLFNLLRSRSYSSSIKPTTPSTTGLEETPTNQGLSKPTTTTLDISSVTGAPDNLRTTRHVYIYQASKSAMTSGRSHINAARPWLLEFDSEQERWENPMIGWTSSRDTAGQVSLRFATLEAAKGFADRNGWRVARVQEAEETKWKIKSYASNFRYSPGPLRYIPTK